MTCAPPKIGQHPVHPLCALVPEMDPDQFRRFCVSIQKYGQRKPIQRWRGQIVFGRMRLKACLQVGTEPWIEDWKPKGRTPEEIDKEIREGLIIDDLDRRHIGDKSVLAYAVAQLQGTVAGPGRPRNGENSPLSLRELAKQNGVDRETLRDAFDVKERGSPALKRAVATGKVKASDAANALDLKKTAQTKALREVLSGKAKTVTAAAVRKRREGHIDGASDKTDWYEGTFRITEMAETPDLFLKTILKALDGMEVVALDVGKRGKPRREFVGFCRRDDCNVGVYKNDRHHRHEDGSVECGECRPGR